MQTIWNSLPQSFGCAEIQLPHQREPRSLCVILSKAPARSIRLHAWRHTERSAQSARSRMVLAMVTYRMTRVKHKTLVPLPTRLAPRMYNFRLPNQRFGASGMLKRNVKNTVFDRGIPLNREKFERRAGDCAPFCMPTYSKILDVIKSTPRSMRRLASSGWSTVQQLTLSPAALQRAINASLTPPH